MIRKIFIVARGNSTTYESLQNSLGTEGDVAIIYDRRRARGDEDSEPNRRRHSEIDEEILTRGWAVVRNEQFEPIRELELATTRYNKLREIWKKPDHAC